MADLEFIERIELEFDASDFQNTSDDPDDPLNGLIPWDLEERRRRYPKAFKELARYMD